MFDAIARRKELLANIDALSIWTCGNHATPDALNGIGEEIKQIGKLVADYVEARMADASASISVAAIHEEDVGLIIDAFGDCAGQLHEAAEREMEAA